ncbi:MAG TPA: hypothetical protein VI997_04975 [Candidatus Thermoplasmatota archaeon]|nr:hypothetical protein [Candidatus Thermoplasmatota archaeon]
MRLLAVVLLLALAAPPAAAEAGSFLLAPEEPAEVRIGAGPGQRIAYQFNVTPRSERVTFNIHYVREGGVVYDREPDNFSVLMGTHFPIRAGEVFLQWQNPSNTTAIRVAYEWHFVRPVPNTRDVPAAPAGAAVLAFLLAAARRNAI